MDRPILMALVLAFLLLLLGLMFLGWRRRQRSQSRLPRPLGLPDDLGPVSLEVAALYVATTVAGEPLNRIAVGGLGYRSRATVGVTAQGLALSIPGQATIFIPAADIRSVEKATWAIDRVVEEGGLVLIRWALGEPDADSTEVDSTEVDSTEVDSYVRIGEPALAAQFLESVRQLHANVSQTGGRAQ